MPCSPCASPVSTATGTPIGASAAKTARPQIKTAPPYHKNPQHDCITLDRTRERSPRRFDHTDAVTKASAPTVTGCLAAEARMSANTKLFQQKMKASKPAAAIPGPASGTAMRVNALHHECPATR